MKSAVFHYEFEFIHPFADGNGRMGRLWHSLLLGTWKELFFWLPIEELVRARQKEYYDALGQADREADSCEFVRFILEVILGTLKQTVVAGNAEGVQKAPASEAIQHLLDALGSETLPAVEIMARLGLSHRPTFRKNYLIPALNAGAIEMTIPDKPNSRKQKYRRK